MTPTKMILITLIFLLCVFGIVFMLELIPEELNLGQFNRSAFENNNGIITFSYKVPLRGATNTPCSIQSPDATSTIVHASVVIRSGATTTLLTEIGKAANTGATTTSLGRLQLAASTQGTVVATSTLNDNDNLIISPLNYVNTRFGRSSGYTDSLNGSCEVIFRVL